MSHKPIEHRLYEQATQVFFLVAEDIDISPDRLPILTESTQQDIVKCHQLLNSIIGKEISAERVNKICFAIKHTLSSIARDTAPQGGFAHLLREQTIAVMRQCFALISERERSHYNNHTIMKPYFADEEKAKHVFVNGPSQKH